MLGAAVHVGTLGAVILYLWPDVWLMLRGIVRLVTGTIDEGARLAWLMIVASVPVIALGLAVKVYLGGELRSPVVIGWASIGFGVVLYFADRFGFTIFKVEHMRIGGALLVGIAQAFALIPGASRSGTTMTMARMLGFERVAAARFSMLLSMPAVAGAGTLLMKNLVTSGNAVLQADALLAIGLSVITALLAITAMIGWLQRASYTPFVVYRILMGAAVLWLVH